MPDFLDEPLLALHMPIEKLSMNEQSEATSKNAGSDFIQEAGQSQTGIIREYVAFLRHNKKWWLIPIVVTLMLVGVLVVLSSTAVAPFIYTLF